MSWILTWIKKHSTENAVIASLGVISWLDRLLKCQSKTHPEFVIRYLTENNVTSF